MESATIDSKEFVRLNDCEMSYAAAKQVIRDISARGKFVDDEDMKYTKACCLLVKQRAKERNDKAITTLLEQMLAPDNIDKHIYRVNREALNSSASDIARAGMASAVITTKGNPEEAGIETISLDAYEDSKLASSLRDQQGDKLFGQLTEEEQRHKLRKILRYSDGLLEYFDYLPKSTDWKSKAKKKKSIPTAYVEAQLAHGLEFLCRECFHSSKSQQNLRLVVYAIHHPQWDDFEILVKDLTSLALSAKEWEGNVDLLFGLIPSYRGADVMHKRYIRIAKRALEIEKNIGAFYHTQKLTSDYQYTDPTADINGPIHKYEKACRDIALKVEKVISCEGLITCPKELAAIRCGAKP